MNHNGLFFYNIFELNDLNPFIMSNQNPNFSYDMDSLKKIKMLGIQGSSKNYERLRCSNLLYHTCRLNLYVIVIKLLNEFRDIDVNISAGNRGATPLITASENGHTKIVK